MTMTMMTTTTTMTTETNQGEGIIGRRRLRQRRIRIRLKKTAIMRSFGVNNVFVDDVIVFVYVTSVSPGTYPMTSTRWYKLDCT